MRHQERLSPALYRLLALLTVSVIVNYIDRGNLSTAAPLLKDELGFLTPAIAGFIVNRTGSFFLPFAITALVAVLGCLCWLFAVGSVKQVVWLQPRDLAVAAAEST